MIAGQNGFGACTPGFCAKGTLRGVFRTFILFAGIWAGRYFVLGAAMDLTTEAAGYVMLAHGFSCDLIKSFRLDIIGVLQLI